MKKIFLTVLVIATALNIMATETARLELEVVSANGWGCAITLVQDDAATTGASVGSAEMDMTDRQVAFYAMNGGYKYEIYVTNDFGELPFGLKTNASTSYTLNVLSATGETMTMYDATDGSMLALVPSATKTFTADANQPAIEDRFRFFVAASPSICHRNGNLQVFGSNGMTVKVLNMDGTPTKIADTNITSNLEVDIPLAGLDAGQYKVEWNSQTLIIDVQ